MELTGRSGVVDQRPRRPCRADVAEGGQRSDSRLVHRGVRAEQLDEARHGGIAERAEAADRGPSWFVGWPAAKRIQQHPQRVGAERLQEVVDRKSLSASSRAPTQGARESGAVGRRTTRSSCEERGTYSERER
jgi:hypothetical protein